MELFMDWKLQALLVENHLNGKFYRPKVFHYGFKIQSLTWPFYTADLKIYSPLALLKTLMNSASKKQKYLSRHEGKAFRVVNMLRSAFGRT